MKTIKELRQNGWKVRVTHYRMLLSNIYKVPVPVRQDYIREHNMGDDVSAKGGITVIDISHPTLKAMNSGKPFTISAEAKCSPKDNYNKKLGVKIALGRVDWDEFATNFN